MDGRDIWATLLSLDEPDPFDDEDNDCCDRCFSAWERICAAGRGFLLHLMACQVDTMAYYMMWYWYYSCLYIGKWLRRLKVSSTREISRNCTVSSEFCVSRCPTSGYELSILPSCFPGSPFLSC